MTLPLDPAPAEASSETPVPALSTTSVQLIASAALIALIFLCLAWELFLAPLRPGGSWLVLKALPLLLPLFGVLRGQRYSYQWSTLLSLLYFCEGLVRATSDADSRSQLLAVTEIALSQIFFWAAVLFARRTRPSLQKAA